MTEVFTSEKAGPKGSTVPIRFIPGGLRQRFVGRAEELRWLESVFTSGSANKSGRRAALYGMTGIGKTQLVISTPYPQWKGPKQSNLTIVLDVKI